MNDLVSSLDLMAAKLVLVLFSGFFGLLLCRGQLVLELPILLRNLFVLSSQNGVIISEDIHFWRRDDRLQVWVEFRKAVEIFRYGALRA